MTTYTVYVKVYLGVKFVRKLFVLISFLCVLCLTAIAQAAMVTDARWGVSANDVLRFVIAVDKPVHYNIRLEGNALRVLVNADVSAKAKGTWGVRSKFADSMTMKQEGSLAVLQVPLKQSLTADNYKTFVLRQNASNQAPYRIIVDIDSKKTVAKTVENKPIVSTQPVKAVNSGVTWNTSNNSTTGNGSWTDRFKKPGTVTQKLTPSERVKLSIEQAKNAAKEKQMARINTNSSVPVVSNTTIKTTTNVPVAVKAQNTNVPATNVTTKPQANTTVVKNTTQGDLKRILNAKRAARREAAAEAEEKKKKNKNRSEVAAKAVTNTQVTSKNTVDGLVVIKGTGRYKTSGGIKDKIITLDAGHGGSDSGAIGLGGTMEKDLTLPITKRVAELLTKAGAKVHMTRIADKDVHGPYATDRQELQARVNVAEKYNSDLFISIHINSSTNRDITGVSCYYYPKTSNDARIAKCIQNRLLAGTGMKDLYIREAGFYVIKRNSMPATLLELGFISNRKEEAVMRTATYQEKAAQAILDGIKQYFS